MPVVGSGQIDLNQIHVEAGGGSGTQCSQNDADIRNLIGKGSGVQSALTEWYGASAAWETVITCGNPGGGSPGTFSGYAAYGALTNSGGQNTAAQGSATVVVDPIPPSDGVASWSLNAIGREQNFGDMFFRVAFRDTSKPPATLVEPNNTNTTVPFTKITLAHNAAYTLNAVTILGSSLNSMTSAYSYRGSQWLFGMTNNTTTSPTYDQVTSLFLTTGNVYIKFE